MWFPAAEFLGKSTPANAFLVCRWNEFFDSQTPDSYRPRICHLPVLVSELADLSEAVLTEDGLRKHLRQVKQECRARLDEDTGFFKICTAADVAVLTEVAAEAADDAVIAAKARQLRDSGFSLRFEAAALSRGQAEIIRHLGKPNPGKRAADRWLGLWATIALHRGYVWSAAFRPHDEQMLPRTVPENVAAIAAGLAQIPQPYVCVVAVVAQPETRDAATNPDEVPPCVRRLKAAVNTAKIRLGHHSWLTDHTPDPHELLLVSEESGVGPVDALHKFARRLQPMLNLLGFYRGAPPATPIRRGWAGPTQKELIACEIASLNPRHLHPRKNAVRLTGHALGIARTGRLNGVLANALELHNMAISSTDLRVQFVTMWSALECLASTVAGDSVISRVMNLLVPIVTWRRLEKEIRYLALNLRQWRLKTGSADLPSLALPNATPDEVPGEDVLLAVTRPTNHPDMVVLLGEVAAHPLLLWRTTTTWEVFHDPAALAADLTQARERLTWHIGRIYRVRNRLVHAGDDSPLLSPLLDNLQFYLSTTISRLLHGVSLDSSYDASKAAAHWCSLADRVQKQLVEAPGALTVADVMSRPRLLAGQCPWGNRP